MHGIGGKHVKGLAVLASLALLAGCNNGSAASARPRYPSAFNLAGDVRLSGAQNVGGTLTGCIGRGAYAEMQPGGTVSVLSTEGRTLATGDIKYSTGTDVTRSVLVECVFRFVVNTVPKRKSYLVKVGKQKPMPVTIEQIFAKFSAIWLDINQPNVTPDTTLPPAIP